eukprot:3657470-Amphidinium_carterae.1
MARSIKPDMRVCLLNYWFSIPEVPDCHMSSFTCTACTSSVSTAVLTPAESSTSCANGTRCLRNY